MTFERLTDAERLLREGSPPASFALIGGRQDELFKHTLFFNLAYARIVIVHVHHLSKLFTGFIIG